MHKSGINLILEKTTNKQTKNRLSDEYLVKHIIKGVASFFSYEMHIKMRSEFRQFHRPTWSDANLWQMLPQMLPVI